MSQSPYSKRFVDHFLQADIIERLAIAEAPLRFSQLKEDGIENSLFMYHLNKLIARKVVEKLEDKGFALTAAGANWVNMTGVGVNVSPMPRPLIQLVVLCNDQILLGKRKGQFAQLLNQYMLPGQLHSFGSTAEEVAKEYATSLFNSDFTLMFLATLESLSRQEGLEYHTISQIFTVSLSNIILPDESRRYSHEWIDLDDIQKNNEQFATSERLIWFIHKLRTNTLTEREFFIAPHD